MSIPYTRLLETSDLVCGGRGVNRPRRVRNEGRSALLGKVDGGVESAGRVDQTCEHLWGRPNVRWFRLCCVVTGTAAARGEGRGVGGGGGGSEGSLKHHIFVTTNCSFWDLPHHKWYGKEGYSMTPWDFFVPRSHLYHHPAGYPYSSGPSTVHGRNMRAMRPCGGSTAFFML